MVVKAASLPSAPAVQATIDPQDPCTAPQTLWPSLAEERGHYTFFTPCGANLALLAAPGLADVQAPPWHQPKSLLWQEQATDTKLQTQFCWEQLTGVVRNECKNLLGATGSCGDPFCSAAGSPRCLEGFLGDARSRAQRLLHKQRLMWLHVPGTQQELHG